ncbi:hypothetical protein TNCV_1319231 [Trichonephila clavipes]|nr:hypothetical protein TNCV_1319231 [Trichonephila clavipes]
MHTKGMEETYTRKKDMDTIFIGLLQSVESTYYYRCPIVYRFFLCLDNEHIFEGDQGYTPQIMDEILTTARDLELEVNEDDIEELIMGHEDELTTEQEILNEEHQETLSPSEQEKDDQCKHLSLKIF